MCSALDQRFVGPQGTAIHLSGAHRTGKKLYKGFFIAKFIFLNNIGFLGVLKW